MAEQRFLNVEDLYAGLLGRTPDVSGLQYWRGQFGNEIDAVELNQFRQAAAAEIARQQQNAYAQELASANVQRVTAPQTILDAVSTPLPTVPEPTVAPINDQIKSLYNLKLGRDPESPDAINYWASQFGNNIDAAEIDAFVRASQPELEARPVEQINSLLAAPPTGSKEAGVEAYALNQQVLQMDKFRIDARKAYDNPALFNEIIAQVQASDLQADRKKTVVDLISADAARFNAAVAQNPNVTSGQYISNAAKALDDQFGGVLGVNQANVLSLDFKNPAEVVEALSAFRASNERLLPEDALRVARQYDAEDARNIGLSLNTSSNSRGQEGLLGSTFGVNQAMVRYDPQANEFKPDQGGAKKDVFAAQFNAALNIGDRLPNTEGLTAVGDPKDGFFTKKLGNPGAYDLFGVYKLNPNTGEAVQVGTSTNFNPELSGFKKFVSSPLGQIIIAIGANYLLPGVSSFLSTGTFSLAGVGSTLATDIIAGGLLGLGSAALTGQDLDIGALLGAISGGSSGYIGSQGGLGNVLRNVGFELSDDFAKVLNKYVSGHNVASPDDIASARAAISSARAAGALSDDAARIANETIEAVAQESDAIVKSGILNQANPNVQTNIPGLGFTADGVPFTPRGYGLTNPIPGISQYIDDILSGVSFADPEDIARAAQQIANVTGDTITLTAPGGVGITRVPIPLSVSVVGGDAAPTVDVTTPRLPTPTPIPLPIPPAPLVIGPITPLPQPPTIPIDKAPPVDVVDKPPPPPNEPTIPITIPLPPKAPIDDLSRPVEPTDDTTIIDDIGNIGTIIGENLTPALLVASALNRTPVPTGVGNETLPAWVFDPAMSGAIPRIQAAQAARPAPMPNLFNAQFRRGGLGAGQFIGYDLLNRTGDIPLETLLGVSPIATGREALLPIRRDGNGITPLPYVPNLLGINYGQAPTSATSLV